MERDQQSLETLHSLGWKTLVIWECELKDMDALAEKIRAFLEETLGDFDPLQKRIRNQ